MNKKILILYCQDYLQCVILTLPLLKCFWYGAISACWLLTTLPILTSAAILVSRLFTGNFLNPQNLGLIDILGGS